MGQVSLLRFSSHCTDETEEHLLSDDDLTPYTVSTSLHQPETAVEKSLIVLLPRCHA